MPEETSIRDDNRFKNYIKNKVQQMRPYVEGEDMTLVGVPVGVVPEAGGMVAIDLDNPTDMWYITPELFHGTYVVQDNPDDFLQLLLLDIAALTEKTAKLVAFMTHPSFKLLSEQHQKYMDMQLRAMQAYLEALGLRLGDLQNQLGSPADTTLGGVR